MSEEENVNIHFIVPKGLKSENLCSDDMKMAFQVRILLVLRIYCCVPRILYFCLDTVTSRLSVPMPLSRVVWNMSYHQSGS
jgi:hypothetical protein